MNTNITKCIGIDQVCLAFHGVQEWLDDAPGRSVDISLKQTKTNVGKPSYSHIVSSGTYHNLDISPIYNVTLCMINTKATAKFTNDLDEEDHVEFTIEELASMDKSVKGNTYSFQTRKEAADLMDMKASVEITFTDVFEETVQLPEQWTVLFNND